jgi:branched-chain amino acid transport system ATP-binding protein
MLRVDRISKSFGGAKVLDDVTFTLEPGNIKGLIGPNGAGKTTLFNIITGYYRPDSGQASLTVSAREYPLTHLKTHRIARIGVGRTYQKPAIAWNLTVFENVLLGALMHDFGSRFVRRRAIRDWAETCLDDVGIDPALWHVDTNKVTIATIKKIEFARAIALAPALILFDEVCSGLSHAETDEFIGRIIQYKNRKNVAVLFVEHDLRAVRNVCGEVVVLNFGTVLFEGPTEKAFSNIKVIEAYIGEDHE